jgi:hypothetical protein
MSQRRRTDDCQGERIEAGDITVTQFPKRAANDIDETEALYKAHVATTAANSARQRFFSASVFFLAVGVVLFGFALATVMLL